MTSSAGLAIAWVFAATVVAMLPMKRQYAPGVALLIAAPALIGFLAVQHGWIVGVASLMAFLSMFRNPLRFFWRKWRGLETMAEPKEPK